MIKLLHGDCLDLMKDIPDGSVDMVMCDLPYGTTACKWDVVIPFDKLWACYNRIVKRNGAIVLTAREPFTSLLVCSALDQYKHKWIWNKKQSGSFQTAKWMPLQIEEDIVVFSKGGEKVNYFPQMRTGVMRMRGGAKAGNQSCGQSGEALAGYKTYSDQYFPTNIIEMANPRLGTVHPTQKPVELMEYLIKTYTNEGETVLDNCMGGGTTGVACKNLNRSFIGMEKVIEYFQIAKDRINPGMSPAVNDWLTSS